MLGAKHFSVIGCKNVKSSERNFGYSKLDRIADPDRNT